MQSQWLQLWTAGSSLPLPYPAPSDGCGPHVPCVLSLWQEPCSGAWECARRGGLLGCWKGLLRKAGLGVRSEGILCSRCGELLMQAKSWALCHQKSVAFTFYRASGDSQKESWLKCCQHRLWIHCYSREYRRKQTTCLYNFITAVLVCAVLTSVLIPDNGQAENIYLFLLCVFIPGLL